MSNSFPNQYINGLSQKEKALKWKPKKWFKLRHLEDMSDPRARLVPIYKK